MIDSLQAAAGFAGGDSLKIVPQPSSLPHAKEPPVVVVPYNAPSASWTSMESGLVPSPPLLENVWRIVSVHAPPRFTGGCNSNATPQPSPQLGSPPEYVVPNNAPEAF